MSKEDAMQTIDRAIKILKSFSMNDQELSLADLHRKLGLAKSSLQRILNTLVLHGLLDKDEKQKTYQLGIELYFLGELVEKNSHLLSMSRLLMEDLRDKLGESISLNIIHQKERKCIGYLPSLHELTTISYVGQTSPLYAGASAKLLMAYLPPDELTEILNQIELNKITDHTIIDKEELRMELEKIKSDGYSISINERVRGKFAISAPIKNRLNEVVAGLSLTMPTVRVDQEITNLYINEVKKTAAHISMKLY